MSTTTTNDLDVLADKMARIGLYVESMNKRTKIHQSATAAIDAMEHFAIAVKAVRLGMFAMDHAEAWRDIAMHHIGIALRHYAQQGLHETLLDTYVAVATFEVGVAA